MLVGAAEGDSAFAPASGIAEAAGRSNRAVVVFSADKSQEAQAAEEAASRVRQAQPEEVVDVSDGTIALPLNQPHWDSRKDGDGSSYDLVVTSVPAPSEHPVAMALAASTDAAIVVATAGRTQFDEARATAESLRVAGVPLVASILIQEGHEDHEERPESDSLRTA